MTAGFEMRVSDAERDAAAAELREHFASGRLTQDELNERLDQAFAAKTRGDLNALFTDLPSSGPSWSDATGQGNRAFGASGPFGPGPFGGGQRDSGSYGPRSGRPLGAVLAPIFLLLPLLVVLSFLGIFGIGTGRPLGIVLIFAALALLRRLLLIIFGRRGFGFASGRGRGPRGRRRC